MAARRPALTLDDVVDLDQLRLAGLDPDLGEHRHQPLAEGVELLAGVPDLADAQVALAAEADVVIEALRGEVARLFELADALVVLRRRQRRRGKSDQNTHRSSLVVRPTLTPAL